MSLQHGFTPDDATGSIEVKEADQDIEMQDSSSGANTDAEGEVVEDGNQHMFHTIQQLTAYLSTVEEE